MTTTDDILTAARKRLDAIPAERVALDAEEAKLRRMLGAVDQPVPAKLVPLPWPPVMPDPLTPWWAQPGVTSTWCGPVDIDGRPLPCGRGEARAVRKCSDFCGAGCDHGAHLFAEPTLIVQGDTLWRQNGVSDLTGQPYYVGTPLLVDDSGRRYGLS